MAFENRQNEEPMGERWKCCSDGREGEKRAEQPMKGGITGGFAYWKVGWAQAPRREEEVGLSQCVMIRPMDDEGKWA